MTGPCATLVSSIFADMGVAQLSVLVGLVLAVFTLLGMITRFIFRLAKLIYVHIESIEVNSKAVIALTNRMDRLEKNLRKRELRRAR